MGEVFRNLGLGTCFNCQVSKKLLKRISFKFCNLSKGLYDWNNMKREDKERQGVMRAKNYKYSCKNGILARKSCQSLTA